LDGAGAVSAGPGDALIHVGKTVERVGEGSPRRDGGLVRALLVSSGDAPNKRVNPRMKYAPPNDLNLFRNDQFASDECKHHANQ
jgi:hypothetical protein